MFQWLALTVLCIYYRKNENSSELPKHKSAQKQKCIPTLQLETFISNNNTQILV